MIIHNDVLTRGVRPEFHSLGNNASQSRCLRGVKESLSSDAFASPAVFLNEGGSVYLSSFSDIMGISIDYKIDGNPVLCGGYDDLQKCLAYNEASDEWTQIGSTIESG